MRIIHHTSQTYIQLPGAGLHISVQSTPHRTYIYIDRNGGFYIVCWILPKHPTVKLLQFRLPYI